MAATAWLVFLFAALLEVSGDAVIRKGLRVRGVVFVVLGILILGCYGLMVNMVKWNFSKLIGVYVAVFATISVLFGRFAFGEDIPLATWIGLSLIVAGGLVIQFGSGH